MLGYSLRGTLPLIASYAIICVVWAEFSPWIPPTIVKAAYNPSIPNLVSGKGMLPVEYYLDRWSMVAAAVPLAVVLHLVVVLLIGAIDSKKPRILLESAGSDSLVNVVLTAFSAAFLALTVLSGDRWDYTAYLAQWIDVLEGRDPWNYVHTLESNAYGPLFNLLAPLVWYNLLANKLLFAFGYLLYVIWLIKDFGRRRGFVTYSCPWMLLLLLNPFPWWQIAYLGYFDILVGLACVAAVHWQVSNKDWLSGTSLAVGILLKFMPIVILPFLAFNGRVHFRLISSCVGVVVLGVVMSLLVWGTSTFEPLTYAATRDAVFSIYTLLDSTHSPLRLFWDLPNSQWLAEPILVIAGLGVYAWCVLRRTEPALSTALAVLVTLLFYWVWWDNYQMVFFVLILYWAVSEWERFNEHPVLAALLGGYFGLLTVADLARWNGLVGYIFYSNMVIILLWFLGGCALIVALSVLGPYERTLLTGTRNAR
jgi:hypothetical protein